MIETWRPGGGFQNVNKVRIGERRAVFADIIFFPSFQEYGCAGVAHATSEYERRMMSVFTHVLEEVESLNRKYAPVSYMASTL